MYAIRIITIFYQMWQEERSNSSLSKLSRVTRSTVLENEKINNSDYQKESGVNDDAQLLELQFDRNI